MNTCVHGVPAGRYCITCRKPIRPNVTALQWNHYLQSLSAPIQCNCNVCTELRKAYE